MQLIQELEKLLNNPPFDRDNKIISQIKDTLSEFQFFKKMNKYGNTNLIYQYLKLRKIKNDYIFKYGDPPKNFYFILKGEANVIIPQKISKGKKSKEKVVKVLKAFQTFGEMGMISTRGRSASIFSKNELVLLELPSKIYIICIKEIEKRKQDQKIEYLQKYFSGNIGKINLQKISYYFQKITFQKGNIVKKENQECEELLLLIKGFVVITKKQNCPNS